MNKNRLVGGEFLLDLTMISFVASVDAETFTDITNQEVINQLTNLKTFIRNPKSIKPVWVRLQDSDDYIVTRGELSKDKDSNVFVIRIKFKGQILTINVEFTQMLNEDNQPLDDYYIDSGDAGYNLVSQNNLSSIVDNQGNPRFIEGEISVAEATGVTKVYGKWSLSATHLLIVLSVSLVSGTNCNTIKGEVVGLPQWIMDKIFTIGGSIVVRRNTDYFFADDISSQNTYCILTKDNGKLELSYGGLTLTADRSCTTQFDLLIDTDEPAEEIGD